MKVPLSWLADYVGITLPVDALAHRLSMAGAEVEAIERSGDWGDLVRVGLVTAVEPHPDADRLRLATVDYGGAEPQTVVCGAPNVATGQKIAFALEGAALIDAHSGQTRTLKKSKIRGVVSSGMVCSERELGLSDEHEGILVLDEALALGTPLTDVLGETVLDITPTPNRPDHLSILGIAREVAALTGGAVREPETDYAQDGPPIEQATSVEIADPDLCSRYVATIIRGVAIRPSPDWLQRRLLAAGQRPINNVVDVTNFVMLEMGQPLHAFDYDRLAQGRIIVRRPHAGEKIRLLDGKEYELGPDHLLIADATHGVALGGVMGAVDSEVTPGTSTVLLEAACFHGGSIRRTADALKQRTEASIRFEKGLNPELAAAASARAMRLLLETAGGVADAGLIDTYPGKTPPARVQLTSARLQQIAGIDLPVETVRSILTGLGLRTQWKPPGTYIVEVPPWRSDIAIPDDVVEEVARIYGYDNLPSLGLIGALPDPLPDLTAGDRLRARESVRDALVAMGCSEVINYAATSADALAAVPGSAGPEPLLLLNPMSARQDRMRTSLRPGVLAAYSQNARGRSRTAGPLQLFEAGKVFLPGRDTDLPEERVHVVLAVGGSPAASPHVAEPATLDLFDVKALLDGGAAQLRLSFDYAPPPRPEASDPALLPGVSATVGVAAGEGKRRKVTPVGVVGQLQPALCERLDITGPAFLAELDIDALAALPPRPLRIGALSRYPAVVEDLAIVVDQGVAAAAVAAILTRQRLVERADLFDVYTGPQIPDGKKSLAYAISYRAVDRTLTDEEVAKLRAGIVKQLQRELSASIREG